MNLQPADQGKILQFRLKTRAASLVDLKSIQSPKLSETGLVRSPRIRNISKTHLPPLNPPLRNITKVKTSNKPYGPIKAFAACTNQGLVRSYNEDRVTIIPKMKIANLNTQISFFGLFDGHGGAGCADFLAESLHRYLFSQLSKYTDVKEGLVNSFAQAEETFLQNCCSKNFDQSGSCGLACVVTSEMVYVANVGDSRAILSSGSGKMILQITEDHKPSSETEKKRIEKAGGFTVGGDGLGVSRVVPGKLSVSRAFGDISAKSKSLGGNPNVLIAKPDVYRLKISGSLDFLVIASDGVFDVLGNEEVVKCVWDGLGIDGELYERTGKAAKNVVERAMAKGTSDNVTCTVIVF